MSDKTNHPKKEFLKADFVEWLLFSKQCSIITTNKTVLIHKEDKQMSINDAYYYWVCTIDSIIK
jgi:hypothetical protein